MSEISYLQDKTAIRKLQDLATEVNVCLFSAGPGDEENEGCRPMSTSGVDEEGTIWFLSDRNSEKNKEIMVDPHVKLYFSHPGKNIYLVVSGQADIVYDREKIRELWNSLDKTWFKGGEEDPTISLIRVKPVHAHYWDVKGNKMVNFFKMVASVASGKTLVDGEEGSLMIH